MRQSDTYFRPTKSRISVSLYQPAESCLLVSGDESLIQAADTRFFGVVVCISLSKRIGVNLFEKIGISTCLTAVSKPSRTNFHPRIYTRSVYIPCVANFPSLSPSYPHSPLAPYTSLVCPRVYSSGLPAAPCLACLASDPSSSHARQISACAPAPTHPPLCARLAPDLSPSHVLHVRHTGRYSTMLNRYNTILT